MLEVKNLTKVYDDGTVALRDLSFEVQDGEFLIIIGLSGSGKSTLLRCINRLIDPTEGQILWDGVDITAAEPAELREIRRQIGMIFQQFNLVKRSNVITNVLAGRLGYVNPWASLLHRFPAEDREMAIQALERVGIADQAHKRADELSGGQQQRVGIARALMQNPELMLVDEPVSALDPATSHSIMRYLEELNEKDGVSMICSLHFLSLARAYADRIIALKDGITVFDGLPEDIDDARFREIYGEEAEQVEIR
ncbi:MAG: phosphonate ABC transporter ATP-binding protein [Anaerolineae bacterium]|nr:phosphonate ABC transporter ATP-binding protein [Anaerolineae bacterium]